ncbi:MAG: PA14 domain-containing protein, partial [Anaerolineae bacterium]
MTAPRPHRSLAGLALLLTFVAIGAVLLVVLTPMPGQAAPSPARPDSGVLPATPTITTTVFLPLALRPAAIPANVWTGEYYANANLDGDPVYTTQETRIDYDWGSGGAPSGLPINNFSIRWTGDWELDYGEYTFFVYADDSVLLWLDGELLIDAWTPGQGNHQAQATLATAGRHEIKLEYY